MNIHENPDLFNDVVDATSIWKGIRSLYIEKDYWVCKVLKNLSNSIFQSEIIFKGGTSLSKAFGIIERFSEDIDLAIIKRDNLTDNQIKRKMKQAISCIASDLREDPADLRMSKEDAFVKYLSNTLIEKLPQVLLIRFQKTCWSNLTLLPTPNPACSRIITSYIYDFLKENGDEELISEYDLYPFEVSTLCPKRTFTEKIFAIGSTSYREHAIENLKTGIRHFYDLHMLFSHKYFGNFISSTEFPLYCHKVKEADHTNANFGLDWDTHPLSSAPIFKNPNEYWAEISLTYERDFGGLVFGNFPDKSEIEKSLIDISNHVIEHSMV